MSSIERHISRQTSASGRDECVHHLRPLVTPRKFSMQSTWMRIGGKQCRSACRTANNSALAMVLWTGKLCGRGPHNETITVASSSLALAQDQPVLPSSRQLPMRLPSVATSPVSSVQSASSSTCHSVISH